MKCAGDPACPWPPGRDGLCVHHQRMRSKWWRFASREAVERETLAQRAALMIESLGGAEDGSIRLQPFGALPGEPELIARMVQMHVSGLHPGQIARQLEAEGIKTRANKEWRYSTIQTILRREGIEV